MEFYKYVQAGQLKRLTGCGFKDLNRSTVSMKKLVNFLLYCTAGTARVFSTPQYVSTYGDRNVEKEYQSIFVRQLKSVQNRFDRKIRYSRQIKQLKQFEKSLLVQPSVLELNYLKQRDNKRLKCLIHA